MVNKLLEALEKRYLRGLVFAIYDNPTHKEQSKLLETYSCMFPLSMLFTYNRCIYLSRRPANHVRSQAK